MRQTACDHCGRVAPTRRWSDAPDRWFLVEQSFDALFEDRDWHFCSADCISTFLLSTRLPTPELREELVAARGGPA